MDIPMWQNNLELYAQWWWLLIPLMIWSLIWKGMALWKAARVGSKGWFIALLLINTVGILEILYLHIFSKKENKGLGSTM